MAWSFVLSCSIYNALGNDEISEHTKRETLLIRSERVDVIFLILIFQMALSIGSDGIRILFLGLISFYHTQESIQIIKWGICRNRNTFRSCLESVWWHCCGEAAVEGTGGDIERGHGLNGNGNALKLQRDARSADCSRICGQKCNGQIALSPTVGACIYGCVCVRSHLSPL